MILKNKLGINNPLELAREEEKITKIKAKQLCLHWFYQYQ